MHLFVKSINAHFMDEPPTSTPTAKEGVFQSECRIVRFAPRPEDYDLIITRNMDSIDTQFATRRNVALQPGTLQAALLDRLTRTLGKNPDSATPRDIYDALSLAVREELTLRWLATQRRVANAHVKRVCYFSIEYLPGRAYQRAFEPGRRSDARSARTRCEAWAMTSMISRPRRWIPGLGNGGLGRLAACFLDSLATLHYPAAGYGIRYDYGIFTQVDRRDGGQREVASSWLRPRNVWESGRSSVRYHGALRRPLRGAARTRRGRGAQLGGHQDIYAVGFDQLIPGNGGPTVNHLRLWSGRAITPFHIDAFNAGNYAAAVQDRSTQRIFRGCCIRTTPRRRARSCGSSSNISS